MIWTLLVCAVIVIAAGASVYFKLALPFAFKDAAFSPEGTLYLSLKPNPASENRISVYALDVQERKLAPFLYDADENYMTSSFSPDHSMLAFSKVVFATSSTAVELFLRRADSSVVQLTDDPALPVNRAPAWSPDGTKIAFVVRADDQGAGFPIADWRIYTYDLATSEERFIDYGTNPMFAPDGTLLVLEGDGLYRFDLSDFDSGTFTKEKIWDTGPEDSLANMKLALSRDGEYLAWGVPDRKQMVLIKIDSWDEFSGTVAEIIPTTAFWPVFSPDSRYLAYEEVDDGTLANPRVVIRDLATGNQEHVFDLSAYAQDALFMTDWQ
jgi:Tol biopolymer transport system component